jgi:hypothetical protein
MKTFLKAVSFTLVVISFLYLFWRPSLSVVFVVETSDYKNIDLQFKFNNKIVFLDSVKVGTYARSTYVIESVPIGFHKFELESKLGNARYSKRMFILFNRTVIFEYFKAGQYRDVPYFRSEIIMGPFFPS